MGSSDRIVAHLDEPARVVELRERIRSKAALTKLYREVYGRYAACLARCPQDGLAVELGAGASFVKDQLPEVVTTDVIAYPGVDQVVDGTRMPFADRSVRALLMQNVFHHIPDASAFLREAERVLLPGGRVLIVDQYPGWIGRFIYRHLHHEPFDDRTPKWQFPSTGPLSDANGALAWIVFERDRDRFASEHPGLELVSFRPHTPLRYWLAGGLKSWCALPGWAFGIATWLDRLLVAVSRRSGCFVDVELVRRR